MPYPSVFLIHAVTVQNRIRKQKLLYDGGTVAFTVGKTVKGGTSNATGVIDAKSGTVASGYLVLITISGTFQNDEALTEVSGTGAAVVNGTITDYKNTLNQYDYYYTNAASPINIRFGPLSESQASAIVSIGGEDLTYWCSAAVPSSSVLVEFDRITTTVTGYTGTYDIRSVIPVCEPVGGISHYSAILRRVVT